MGKKKERKRRRPSAALPRNACLVCAASVKRGGEHQLVFSSITPWPVLVTHDTDTASVPAPPEPALRLWLGRAGGRGPEQAAVELLPALGGEVDDGVVERVHDEGVGWDEAVLVHVRQDGVRRGR